jgi:hypothetical protein
MHLLFPDTYYNIDSHFFEQNSENYLLGKVQLYICGGQFPVLNGRYCLPVNEGIFYISGEASE